MSKFEKHALFSLYMGPANSTSCFILNIVLPPFVIKSFNQFWKDHKNSIINLSVEIFIRLIHKERRSMEMTE